MDELKRRGVRMGGTPYGWQYTKEPDEHGRRNIVLHPGEQRIIQRIWRCTEGLSVLDIAEAIDLGRVRPAWYGVGASDSVPNPQNRPDSDSAASA